MREHYSCHHVPQRVISGCDVAAAARATSLRDGDMGHLRPAQPTAAAEGMQSIPSATESKITGSLSQGR